MSTFSTALGATCLVLASVCATAQTGPTGAPPTHPATGGSDATATPSPTTPPTHPAVGTSGATPEAARKQNPLMDNNDASGDARRGNARTSSKQGQGGSAGRNPTSTDSMGKDNMPKQPATQSR
ncbi:hypothetical protein H6CHR_00181 [Variovorax sp. PBL-H6]|nr:hypothetical protein H6CHR_00181 [Variovorax sp. PBL-H6]